MKINIGAHENRFQIIDQLIFIISKNSHSLAKPDREPINNLNDGDETDPKTETADPAKAGDEVEPGHLGRSLKLYIRYY